MQRKFIDIGQIANARSSKIASIYSTDAAEIRLAIPLNETRFIKIPEAYRDLSAQGSKPKVTIESSYGGAHYRWDGIIDRSEGAVDPQTRLLYLVARIDDPYGKAPNQNRPPLKIGSFVTATIEGKELPDAYEIPRAALRKNNTVYIVDDEGTLSIRKVEVYQKTTEKAIISSGLNPGERICLTTLQYVVNGMEVAVEQDEDTHGVAQNPIH